MLVTFYMEANIMFFCKLSFLIRLFIILDTKGNAPFVSFCNFAV